MGYQLTANGSLIMAEDPTRYAFIVSWVGGFPVAIQANLDPNSGYAHILDTQPRQFAVSFRDYGSLATRSWSAYGFGGTGFIYVSEFFWRAFRGTQALQPGLSPTLTDRGQAVAGPDAVRPGDHKRRTVSPCRSLADLVSRFVARNGKDNDLK